MRLHVVDGTYELFRAYFSKRPDHVVGGRDLKATVGLAGSMIALLHDATEAVSHVAVAFDNPIRSIRNEWYDGYKTDEGVPDDLLGQFDDAERALRALGMIVWSMDRYEADDALATAAARFADQVDQVRILTPDKDLQQMLRGDRVVLVDRLRNRVVDEQALRTARGIGPRSVPDWLALVGDSADGFPGIPGFGEKTASSLLATFERLEAIPSDPRQWPSSVRSADRLAATLAERMPEALLYRKLATLIEDVPLPETLADLAWKGVPREPFLAWCEHAGAGTLASRPVRWRED